MATATLRPETPQCRHWLDELGGPVTVEVRTRRPVLVAGEAVDAITMPPAFGALVQAELEIMMLAGPVVAGPGEGPWTFLTQPANTPPAVPADLLALGVRLVPAGTGAILPTSTDRSGSVLVGRSTRTQPDLGIWSAVIGAARRVADRLARYGTR